MSLLYRCMKPLLFRMDAERAHDLALAAARRGGGFLARLLGGRLVEHPVELAGLCLRNPVGLAAGFDKNGVALPFWRALGFGHVEFGTVTPRPQPGNPRPRMWRLPADRGAINRFGFNNAGAEAAAARLAARPAGAVIGVNLGANRDSPDRAGDYAAVLARLGAHVDFATVNVSSPNTVALRELQGPAALRDLLARVTETRDGLDRRVPVFLKVAPDLTDAEIAAIAATALEPGLDGLIVNNSAPAERARPLDLKTP